MSKRPTKKKSAARGKKTAPHKLKHFRRPRPDEKFEPAGPLDVSTAPFVYGGFPIVASVDFRGHIFYSDAAWAGPWPESFTIAGRAWRRPFVSLTGLNAAGHVLYSVTPDPAGSVPGWISNTFDWNFAHGWAGYPQPNMTLPVGTRLEFAAMLDATSPTNVVTLTITEPPLTWPIKAVDTVGAGSGVWMGDYDGPFLVPFYIPKEAWQYPNFTIDTAARIQVAVTAEPPRTPAWEFSAMFENGKPVYAPDVPDLTLAVGEYLDFVFTTQPPYAALGTVTVTVTEPPSIAMAMVLS